MPVPWPASGPSRSWLRRSSRPGGRSTRRGPLVDERGVVSQARSCSTAGSPPGAPMRARTVDLVLDDGPLQRVPAAPHPRTSAPAVAAAWQDEGRTLHAIYDLGPAPDAALSPRPTGRHPGHARGEPRRRWRRRRSRASSSRTSPCVRRTKVKVSCAGSCRRDATTRESRAFRSWRCTPRIPPSTRASGSRRRSARRQSRSTAPASLCAATRRAGCTRPTRARPTTGRRGRGVLGAPSASGPDARHPADRRGRTDDHGPHVASCTPTSTGPSTAC